MENKTPLQIATEIGVSTTNLMGTQDWSPPLHPNIVISHLTYSDGTIIAFRVRNLNTGNFLSKMASENPNGVNVDAVHNAIVAFERHKEVFVKGAIYSNVPDLDPSSQTIMRGLNVAGKAKIADIVNGQLTNIRDELVHPTFTFNKSTGTLVVDSSALSLAQRTAINNAISALAPSSTVPGTSLPTASTIGAAVRAALQ